MNGSTLVSTAELSRQLSSWRVFDCRHDLAKPRLGEQQYLEGHIPGALFASLDRDLSAQTDAYRRKRDLVVAALSDVGQASGYYDANGHYMRTQPVFGAFALDGFNALTTKPAFDRYQGFQIVHGRCPGSAVQPTPDGSAPWAVPGCQVSSTPPGP